MNDRQMLAKAFAALRTKGYFAKVTFVPCCGSCGHYEIANGTYNYTRKSRVDAAKYDKYVFFNAQSKAWSMPENTLLDNMYLGWSAPGNDATEIVQALRSAGLNADWDGNPNQNVALHPGEK